MYNPKQSDECLLSSTINDYPDATSQVSLIPVETPIASKSKDNRVKAVFFMNIQSLAAAFVAISFKFLNQNGVSVVEFMFYRNFFNLFSNLGLLKLYKVNPLKDTNN